jgi:hypothetical protein
MDSRRVSPKPQPSSPTEFFPEYQETFSILLYTISSSPSEYPGGVLET